MQVLRLSYGVRGFVRLADYALRWSRMTYQHRQRPRPHPRLLRETRTRPREGSFLPHWWIRTKTPTDNAVCERFNRTIQEEFIA